MKSIILPKPAGPRRAYRLVPHPVSGLPRMVVLTLVRGRVIAAKIARLHAGLL
jgi:hypothetical protein